jgi:hypothetical protein
MFPQANGTMSVPEIARDRSNVTSAARVSSKLEHTCCAGERSSRKLRDIDQIANLKEQTMLRMLGKDPNSGDDQSPTVYYDDVRDTYVLQGWKVLDEERLSHLDIPEHETVIEFPRRMMQFFPEVNGG